jgi:hypothetical protein
VGRLITPEIVGGIGQAGQPGDDYLTRLAKLIPGEVLALYLSVENILTTKPDQSFTPPNDIAGQFIAYIVSGQRLPIYCFYGLLIGNIIWLYAWRKKGDPYIGHIVLSTIGFVIWIYAMRGTALLPWYHPQIAGILVAFYTFGVAAIYQPKIRIR